MSNGELPVALFILRLGLGAFLLLFGFDKLVAPATTAEVFTLFYGVVVSHGIVYAAGALEILLGLDSLRIKAEMWNYLPTVERTIKIPLSMANYKSSRDRSMKQPAAV